MFRFGNQVFRLVIADSSPDDFVEVFANHDRIAIDQRNERVGTALYITDQFSVQNEFFSIESGQSDHWFLWVVCGTWDVERKMKQ